MFTAHHWLEDRLFNSKRHADPISDEELSSSGKLHANFSASSSPIKRLNPKRLGKLCQPTHLREVLAGWRHCDVAEDTGKVY